MTNPDPDPGAASETPSPGEAPTAPQAGVLGNLPRSRPAVRSPRRKDAPDPAADAAGAAASSRPEPTAAPDAPDHGSGAEIEALARTGIAVATGAATLGLRIAGRAAAAVRDAVERR
jgi:hypothetical protein